MKWYKAAIILFSCLFLGGSLVALWYTASRRKKNQPSLPLSHQSVTHTDIYQPNAEANESSLALFLQEMTPGTILASSLRTNHTVNLAGTVPKTGEASVLGKALSDGLFLYLNAHNTVSGQNKRISLHQRDDSGTLSGTIEAVRAMLDTDSVFLSPMGDRALEKVYYPLLHAHKAALFFPVAGLRSSFDATLPLIFFRPSYTQEVAALVYYALTVLQHEKIAVFFEESAWGRAGKEAVTSLLADHNKTITASASYQPGTINIQNALKTLQHAQPEVIICIARARPAYNFIRQAANNTLHYVTFLGISRLTDIAQHLAQARGISLVTSSVVPNPFTSSLPIAASYRADMQRYLPNKGLSTYSFEGYITSMLFAYFLDQLPDNATVFELWRAMTQTKNLLFKGLHLEHCNATLSHTIWINEGIDKQWHAYQVKDVS